MLPVRLNAIHDIWSGHVVLAHLDSSFELPPENVLTFIPMPGDIFYYFRPGALLPWRALWPRRVRGAWLRL